VDIAEDAPPVYHWLGVPQAAHTPEADDESEAASTSLFIRLGLSFR
jgi:hypothetical protein